MPVEPTLEELYEDAPCGYLSLRRGGFVTRANRTLLRALGMEAEAVVGQRITALMTVGSRLYAETHWLPRLALGDPVRELPLDLRRADGTALTVLFSAEPVRDADGVVQGVRASLFDATDRRRYEQELIAARDVERVARERLERLQALSTALADAVGVEAVAAALCDAVFEALAPEACTVTFGDEVVGERRERYAAVDGVRTVPVALTVGERALGSLAVVVPQARAWTADEEAFLASAAASGATALRRAHLYAEIQHQALHDPLTGLPNRALLRDRLAHETARARRSGSRFALALVALDGFKLVNDTRGHAAGDEALRHVARRLADAVRAVDLVARLSGDEFVVVACDLDESDDGEALIARVAAVLREPMEVGGTALFLRASTGLVVAGGDAHVDDLLADADVALHAAKRATGADYVRFDPAMRAQAHDRARIETDLRAALHHDELEVYYQPIVCAEDGQLASFEALVRWHHPVEGLVSPARFVPVAEECGLIIDLGRFVLREAALQLASWRAEGLVADAVGVTVNVSARQLEQPELPADVAGVLVEAGLADRPDLLGIEVTESMVMRSDGTSTTQIAGLEALGVRLLLDDFGTGASSLARLRRLPFDTLKIDRAFVTGLADLDGEDAAIAAAIVALAGALDLDVVAEGVETHAQLEQLREMGAQKVQGYLFSRPLPADDIGAMLRTSGSVLTAPR